MSDAVRLREFGRDHSLIHEAVITGRKVEAGPGFWAGLAHDEEFFREVVALAGARGYADWTHGMFAPLSAQLAFTRARGEERGWGVDFDSLGEPPAWPKEERSAVVLDVTLETPQKTFEEASLWLSGVYPDFWGWPAGIKTDPDHLRLYKGITHTPGARWRVIDLGGNRDKSSNIVREAVDPSLLPTAAPLFLAATSPKWRQSMDGDKVPYVELPGYELSRPGVAPWSSIACLGRRCIVRRVGLSARSADGVSSHWAVPVFRE